MSIFNHLENLELKEAEKLAVIDPQAEYFKNEMLFWSSCDISDTSIKNKTEVVGFAKRRKTEGPEHEFNDGFNAMMCKLGAGNFIRAKYPVLSGLRWIDKPNSLINFGSRPDVYDTTETLLRLDMSPITVGISSLVGEFGDSTSGPYAVLRYYNAGGIRVSNTYETGIRYAIHLYKELNSIASSWTVGDYKTIKTYEQLLEYFWYTEGPPQ